MKICLVTPAPPGSHSGNRVTALRWARILRGLGHRVTILQEYCGERCDVVVALHALRSFPSIQRYRSAHPYGPLLLALTGTDLYGSIHTQAKAQQSLDLATRLIVLQPLGVAELPTKLRAKARVIYQSVPFRKKIGLRPGTDHRSFDVCVVGHLRPVKDPFRAALASRLLPQDSRVHVVHAGAALSETMARRARHETLVNSRYHWLGEMVRWKALQVMGRCRLLVLSSKLEGGANVISEAIAASIPVLASRISGSVGLLGEDYPGYFPVGDTRALARLLRRAEVDADFYQTLQAWCHGLRPLIDPAREWQSWRELLSESSLK
jgi:putative glycosyltransferase (TIGR04348 family)